MSLIWAQPPVCQPSKSYLTPFGSFPKYSITLNIHSHFTCFFPNFHKCFPLTQNVISDIAEDMSEDIIWTRRLDSACTLIVQHCFREQPRRHCDWLWSKSLRSKRVHPRNLSNFGEEFIDKPSMFQQDALIRVMHTRGTGLWKTVNVENSQNNQSNFLQTVIHQDTSLDEGGVQTWHGRRVASGN